MNEDQFLTDGVALIDKGGPVMYVLLGVSVIALAIFLVQVYQFTRCRLRWTAFIVPVLETVHRGDAREALAALSVNPNPVARVMEAAILSARNPQMKAADRDAEISRVGTAEIRNLEGFLRGLEVIANLSPLLGLLGTVMGMIGAFAQLEGAGTKVDPALLAGGIWEALLTTAFGLSVAIPALAAYYVLEGQVDNVRANMKDAATRVLGAYGQGPMASGGAR